MKINLQLRYFQEDIVMWLVIITIVLCFGFGFNIAGIIFLVYGIGQKIYVWYWSYRMAKEQFEERIKEIEKKANERRNEN